LLETLPPFESGPGNGQWNLGQYLVARGSDLPLHDLEIEMLPPLTPDEPPKGMAEVVIGQAQGGFAMGVGYALLETLPPFEGGPGNGQWNLGQYLVARGSDLPLHDLEIEMLPPLTPDEPPKGMAEVVTVPVVPAILNAIFDATGRRFRSLPVTTSLLKGALA